MGFTPFEVKESAGEEQQEQQEQPEQLSKDNSQARKTIEE